MRTYDFNAGEILAFDKPLTWTSFNLVKMVRNRLCRRMGTKKLKVGHAGTLDPLATGVLIICTGKATKEIDRLQADTKEYIATIRLGCTTPSFDAEHPVDAHYPTSHITREQVESVLKEKFIGSIMQIPPVYSACKVEGRRAFDYAREGSEVELKAKELIIDEIELLDIHLPEQGVISPSSEEVAQLVCGNIDIKQNSRKRKQSLEAAEAAAQNLSGAETISDGAFTKDSALAEDIALVKNKALAEDNVLTEELSETDKEIPYITIRVVCSKGTYIRALARDIGEALGSGAYLLSLRRTRIGKIKIEDCMQVKDWDQFMENVEIITPSYK